MANATTAKKKAAPKKAANEKAAPKKVAPGKVAPGKVAPGKVAPKVSPLKGMPIDAWLAAKAKGWHGDVIRRVLAVVASAAPSAAISIKWGQPVAEQGGPFLFVRAAKAHVTVGFWRGSELTDPKGLLERGDRMGSWRVATAADLDEKALTALVKDAVQRNLEKGNPAVRGAKT